MQARASSREFAVVLFCLLGIAVLNDFSHNKYAGVTNPLPLLRRLIWGKGIIKGYEDKTMFELLDAYSKDPKSVEAWKGVAVIGRVLPEKASEAASGEAQQPQNVGETFKIYRPFSESGTDEGAHALSVEVHAPNHPPLSPNVWVMVQGKVVPGTSHDAEHPMPRIEAVQVEKDIQAPENAILTPQGEQHVPEAGDEHGH